MAAHSNIVGGSTAKRVIACPGSVKLVQQMPPRPSSSYADEGTLCHTIMEAVLTRDVQPEDGIGDTFGSATVTQELIDTKIRPALAALSEIDPDYAMTYECEAVVGFGDALPGVFGSADLVGRIGDTAWTSPSRRTRRRCSTPRRPCGRRRSPGPSRAPPASSASSSSRQRPCR
jgi:hypothetical protein